MYELLLGQRYDKNQIFQERETKLKFYRLSDVLFYDCINTIYQFIKPFLDNIISILRNME